MSILVLVLVSAVITVLLVAVVVVCAIVAAGRSRRGGYKGMATSQTGSRSAAEGQSAK